MLSYSEFKKVIKSKEKKLSDEQIIQLHELMKFWAQIEFTMYDNKKN